MLPALRPAFFPQVKPAVLACVLAGAAPIGWTQGTPTPVPTPAPAAALEPVVITGSGFEQRAFDTPYSMGIVEAETLQSGGLMVNLSEAMARVPGLTVNSRNNYAQDLQINSRGYGARSTFGVRGLRLYSDGIPATMPDGQGQVAHFDLAGAQRIEVLRGPFSALYGNSSGGVISLISAPVRERYGQIDVDVGRFGTRQVRATAQAPLSDTPGRGWDLRIGASRFETDNFRPQSEAERTLANVRLGYTGERDTVVIAFNHLDQPSLDPLGLTREDFKDDPYQTTEVALPQEMPGQDGRFDTRKNAEQQQLGVNWRHRFADPGALRESALTAYYGQRSVTQWQAIPLGAQMAPTSPGGVIDFDRDYLGLDGRLVWRWALSEERSAQLVAGVAYEESKEDRRGFRNFTGSAEDDTLRLGVTGDLRRDERNKVHTTDAYAQGEIEFAKDWVATVGVRRGELKFRSDDRYIVGPNGDDSGSLSFRYTNPVAALQWRATPALNLYVSAGRGFESPTFNELAYRPDGQTGFNSELQAQKSRQVEVGAKWRDRARGLSVDVALFEAHTDDELAVSRNSGGRSTFQNVGETKRRGAELGAGWVINRSWRTVLALTYLDATYEDDFLTCYGVPAPCAIDDPRKNPVPAGSRISGTSPRSAFAEVAWNPGGSTATELAAEWRAQDRVATNDLNDRGGADDFTEGWATFALRARHQWQLGPQSRLEGLLRVDNVFDREYAGSVIVNEGNRRFYEPGAPRAWLVGVKFRQGF